MIQRKQRLVLFLPHRADPDQGIRVAADLLPLELPQIAALPEANGYEVHIVDAMVHDDYMERLMQLCDGALLFASSCILGSWPTAPAWPRPSASATPTSP